MGRLNEAFREVLREGESDDTIIIRLLGRTGVCLEKLQLETVNQVIHKIISILNKRDFVDVLLPWLAEFTKRKCDDLELTSQLIECLLGLIEDESGALTEKLRNEILSIYESLNQNFSIQS